jgi:hypothetical protein
MENQNCYAGDPVEHPGLFFHKVAYSSRYNVIIKDDSNLNDTFPAISPSSKWTFINKTSVFIPRLVQISLPESIDFIVVTILRSMHNKIT